jgi:pimeloyl-ACP methyl ester carboxylesterase
MFVEHIFDTGATRINYAERPAAGPPSVLLHGGSARWQTWEPLLPTLSQRLHVYAVDLRGHGASEWTPGRYRLRDYADDVVALIRRRIGEPAILFGHSLGGIVATLIAAQYPRDVRALIVGDSPLDRESWRVGINRDRVQRAMWSELAISDRSVEELAEALKDVPCVWPGYAQPVPARVALGEDAPWFGWMAANLRSHDPAMLAALVYDFDAVAAGYELDTMLPAIQCPVLLLQADPSMGGILLDAEVTRAKELLPSVSHVYLEQTNHGLHTHHPDLVAQIVEAFLEHS